MLYLIRPNRLVPQTFRFSFLLIEFQRYIAGLRGSAGLGPAQSPVTIEAFAVSMLVTSWIDRLPEPVPSFAGTSSQEKSGQQTWQQKQSLKTNGGEWLAGFHQ